MRAFSMRRQCIAQPVAQMLRHLTLRDRAIDCDEITGLHRHYQRRLVARRTFGGLHLAMRDTFGFVRQAELYSVSACAMIADWTRRAGQRAEGPTGYPRIDPPIWRDGQWDARLRSGDLCAVP